MFLFFTLNQIVYVNATACLKNDKWNSLHTWYRGDAARRLFSIPTVRIRLSSSALGFYYRSSLHLKHYGHALDPVRWCPKPIAKEVMWWANAIMNCAAVITPSLILFVLAFLMNLLFSNEQFWRILGLCKRLNVDYVMFLTRRDLNLEPRVYGFHLFTGFRMWTYMRF